MKLFSSFVKPLWILLFVLMLGTLSLFVLTARSQSQAIAAVQAGETPHYLPYVAAEPSPTPNCSPPNTLPGANDAFEIDMLNRLNNLRFANNNSHESLVLQIELINAARGHVKDMADNNFVGHQGSNDEFNQYRQEENCYFSTKQGEVIGATNTAGAQAMISIWQSDEGTYGFENALFDGDFRDIGVGYWPGGFGNEYAHYWDISFGRRAGARSDAFYTEVACEYHFKTEDGEATIRLYDPELCLEE